MKQNINISIRVSGEEPQVYHVPEHHCFELEYQLRIESEGESQPFPYRLRLSEETVRQMMASLESENG